MWLAGKMLEISYKMGFGGLEIQQCVDVLASTGLATVNEIGICKSGTDWYGPD